MHHIPSSIALLGGLAALALACGSTGVESSSGSAGSGATATGGGSASGGSSAQGGSGLFGGGGDDCPEPCAGDCCRDDQSCALGLVCAPTQDPCSDNDDCWFDSYCLNGSCVPYETPPGKNNDETCKNQIMIDAIVPAEQCRWTGPPAGDPFPNHFQVMSTPVVVDLDLDQNPLTLAPSIVFTTFPTSNSYFNPGVLRVIDGRDCSHQYTLTDPADATMSPASVAVGDLDGDGRAEIIAAAHGGGVLAFRYNPQTNAFERLWRSGVCSGGNSTPDAAGGPDKWSGPSIHDLDDDGNPEIIYGATVYDRDGCLLSSSLGFPGYSKGMVPVIADVDEDGQMELALGNGIYGWDGVASDWVAESYFNANVPAGQVAVADMGNYPLASQNNQDRAEVVVVSGGAARVQTIEGTVVFGPVTLPGGGTGGPPTIADFDGDGKNEFASAGGSQYVVFDFDCLPGGTAADCNGSSPGTGVLWTQQSKDQSSNVTGSSVFDFDADGSAEAVYADECFLRIYEGASGAVLYSAARSSGTTFENPVIVDVDGDFRTEIVSAVNDYAGTLGCPATDPLFPASTFATNHGIVVLRDAEDRWAASRPVWNQHAYAVTHVGDRGEIPQTSAVALNWKTPGLNNFRQNVQGSLDALGEPDLTAGGDVGAVQCVGTIATIEARVCNRGTLPMVSGTEVAFYRDTEVGAELCRAQIPIALQVAECLTVSCQAELGTDIIDVFVKVDPDFLSDECHENNNSALYKGVACGQVPN